MKTSRIPQPSILSDEERKQFITLIRRMPWLYDPIKREGTQYFTDSHTLLDIGCGDGYLLEQISHEHPHLLLKGIDVDPSFIALGRKRLPYTFVIQGVEDLHEEYDVIISHLTLHHFNDPMEALRKMHSHAKKALLISDQLRPEHETDLERRLAQRTLYLGDKDVPYYRIHERESILAAYDKNEVKDLLNRLGMPHRISFYDSDYYERFVANFPK